MKFPPLAGLAAEETLCNAPLRISRARLDGQAALLLELGGAPLSSAELAQWSNKLGHSRLENTSSGPRLAVSESGTPLCALAGPLSTDELLPLAVQLTETLGQAHDGAGMYRHLSEAAIFLDGQSARLATPEVAALIFAQMQARGEAGDHDAQRWTLRLIAPEQTGRMNRAPDERADLYALGAAFYRMLTGRLPFESADALELVHSHLAKTPLAPREANAQVPPALSDIVLKLLAKTPEERYQSTYGLLEDLRECQNLWQNTGAIPAFELGRRDVSERLQVLARLYGREEELRVLHQAFAQTKDGGESALLLIGGYSGVGKTALAQSLRAEVARAGGIFLSGKIDQFRRNLPYASISEAFQAFVRHLQTESEARIATWRRALQEVLGDNGQVIADVIPEIELIIGPQPPVPALGPSEAMSRFNAVFHAFVGALARPGQPLVLFLDDLQWMDSASLKLMESLVGGTRNLLIIGAFRDNEVSASHPLSAIAERLEAESSERVRRLNLLPLARGSVTQLLADTLHDTREAVEDLARLLVAKTDGNAFFLLQFLQSLHADGLLRFDRSRGRWAWEAARIRQAGISGDVVELMAGKIRKLSPQARQVLPVAACLGNRFGVDDLALVRGRSRGETLDDLREALDTGLLLPIQEDSGEIQMLRFLHDRVQQAAYSLLSEKEKSALHERAGRLLGEQARAQGESVFEDRLFEITNHLNNGSAQLKEDAARLELARLNLRAALKAKNALAYDSAQRYASAGIGILPPAPPQTLAFELHFERCENELSIGDMDAMRTRFDDLFALASTLTEKARAYDLKVLYFTTLTMLPEATQVGLEGLRLLGFAVPEKISKGTVVQEIARVKWIQGRRKTEDLLNLPQVSDPERLAMLKLFSNLLVVAFQNDANLFAVLILKLTSLSMKIGNSPIAPMGYGCYGIILCSPLGDYKAGYEFGQLALELGRLSQDKSSFSRATLLFGCFLSPWRAPLMQSVTLMREGYEKGAEAGDNIYANYNSLHVIFQRIFHGDSLDDIHRENEQYLDFARHAAFKDGIENIRLFRQFIASLQGRTQTRGSFSTDDYDEAAHERAMADYVNLTPKYHIIMKMQALCVLDEPQEALRYARRIFHHPKQLEPLGSLLWVAGFHLYHALAQAMLYPRAGTRQKRAFRFSLELNRRRFAKWARNCPQNFAQLDALIGAELARVRGDEHAAQVLYEKAIAHAERNGFPNHAALAHERAATMSLARGARVLARHHLFAARAGYESWGASEKVRQMDEKYGALLQATPQVLEVGTNEGGTAPTPATEETVSATLDLSTVIKASQAISGEIEWTRLLRVLVSIAIENAGAERGILLLDSGGELRLAAAGHAGAVEVQPLEGRALTDEEAQFLLPLSVVNYAARTRQSVVLANARADELFGADPFIARDGTRSVLCAPIVHQNRLVGVLYLQNDLAEGAFTEDRLRVLALLAAQAAVSLEAARAYARVRKSENQLQSILDNATVVVFMKDAQGRYLLVNEQFTRAFGIARERALGASDFDLFPREAAEQLHANDERVLRERQTLEWEESTLVQGAERTYISVKFPLFDGEGTLYAIGGVSTDITERKRAEQVLADYSRDLEGQVAQRTLELRANNQRLQSTLDQLQDAQQRMVLQENLAYLGTLTAGIAHEIQNPLNFVINFAQISAMLAEDLKTQVEELRANMDPAAHEYLAETVGDLEQNSAKINQHGQRISSIVKSMLLHSRGVSPVAAPANINALLDESIDLVYHALRADDLDLSIRFEKRYDTVLDTEEVPVVAQDLSRVFANIISNAAYATRKRKTALGEGYAPEIAVSSRDLGESIEIRIRDNGGGIPASARAEIFKPFFTTKPTGEGTGLGLSICYDIIVQEHSGDIRVDSATDAEAADSGDGSSGEGFAEFIIRLPKAARSE